VNKVQEAYCKDPKLFGSELMVGIMEGLLNIPNEIRCSKYIINNFMLTSDYYVVTPEYFISSYEDFYKNVTGLCKFFDEPEFAEMLLAKVKIIN
jgi:hypothetical protein